MRLGLPLTSGRGLVPTQPMAPRSGSQALAGAQMVQEASGFPWGTGTQTTFIFETSDPDKAGR